MKATIVLGPAKYGRKKQVSIYKKLHCDNCKKESENVIHTDTSDNEYGGLSLCEKCIYQMIDNFKKGNFKPTSECKLCHENFEVNVNDKLCDYCITCYHHESNLYQKNFNTVDDYLEYKNIKRKFSFVLMYIINKNNEEDYKHELNSNSS